MASFFISHSSRDGGASERIRDRLKSEGYESVFLDFDPQDGIPAGRDWERELYAQLRRSDAVIFVGSAASLESKWCFAELALARATGKPVFPIALEPAVRHPLLADTQSIEWIELDGEGEVAFERLWSGLQRHGFDPRDAFAWDPNRSPFPGLSALEAEDAAVFFGRGAEIEELLSRLQPILASSRRFVALIGASGSGKSSLVRAGLVPRLERMGGRWAVVPPLKPGHRPLSLLARRLASALGRNDWQQIRDRIARDPAEFAGLVDDLLEYTGATTAAALLVVDQAEELVTADAEEQARFLEALGAALEESSPLWVLATLRSEYVTAILEEPAIADVIGPAVVLGLLDRSRIPEVIEGPAHRAGLELEPGLVGLMVEETRGGDALPLLAYTLRQLYDRAGPDRRITLKDYEEIGGVLGALRGRADSVAGELERSGTGSLIIPTLLKFANVERENEPIGRRVLRSNLSTDESEIVRAFVEARLLTTDGGGDATVVGVAHDSLLRSWAPLRQAIDASREGLRLRSELERLADDWDSVGRPDSYLLREDRLTSASSFLESAIGRGELPLVQEFVERSRVQSQAVKRRESELLAGRALESLDDPERGLLLALAAVEEYALSPRAIRALNAAVVASKARLYLRGHGAGVQSAAFSSDGSRVVTGSGDMTARIWDAVSGEELQVLRGHEGWVESVAYSPEGSRVVTASNDKTARVWDAVSGEELQTLLGHDFGLSSVVFSPDGSQVLTASADGTARVWAAVSGEELQVLGSHESGIETAAFSTDGSRVVTSSTDGTARVWEAASGEELLVLRGHEGVARSAGFSPDGGRVVTSDDRTARVWDAVSGEELLVLRGHEGWVESAAFSPDGSRVVTASGDGTARVWDAVSGEELLVLRGHEGWVESAAFSPDGSRVVTASGDGTARVWDITGEELQALRGHEGSVESAGFSSDGSRVVTASHDGTARIWDAGRGEELLILRSHILGVTSAAFSPDGRRVVTSGNETALVSDVASGEELQTFRGHKGVVRSAAFSPDGTRVVTSGDVTARVWDAVSGAELRALTGHDGLVRSAAFSPDGSRVVTASDDGTARMWDAVSGEELQVLSGHEGLVESAAFSHDGNRLVTASADWTARIWDSVSGRELQTLRGHEGGLESAAFSPDGSGVVTASDDGTARIWDVVSGEELQVLRGHEGWVWTAAYSPDGSRVVTASGDKTARVWEILSVDRLLARAKSRVARELSAAERAEYGLLSTLRP